MEDLKAQVAASESAPRHRRSTPLAGAIAVETVSEEGIQTSMAVRHDEAILAGHYPGFPILPGVCLIECAHRSVLAAADARATRVELSEVESTRFLNPVFPGDRVATEVRIERGDDVWRCACTLGTERGRAAEVRLLYRVSGSP